MSAKKILTVGLELASSSTQCARFEAKMSLLDWDIVLFRPEIGERFSYTTFYQGKPCLDDSSSFELKECSEHWRREIKQAVETGKTVLVYLPPLEEVYVDTGQRSYSGTGRNRQATRHVTLLTNYQSIPANLVPVAATGSSMKLAARGAEVLAPYWAEFGESSRYQVLLTEPTVPACLMTRAGDRTVGAMYRSNASAGTLLLLPDIDFYDKRFVKRAGSSHSWTQAATEFAGKLIAAVTALDGALRATSEITPAPPWASATQYALKPEAELRVRLLEAESRVEEAQREKEGISEQLSNAGRIRGLLYEKGKALERVVIDALQLMGFSAARFRRSDSEFDVVFESEEGRLIGEVEGKDTKAVNVDKLRQLAMNIHEDLQREDSATAFAFSLWKRELIPSPRSAIAQPRPLPPGLSSHLTSLQ